MAGSASGNAASVARLLLPRDLSIQLPKEQLLKFSVDVLQAESADAFKLLPTWTATASLLRGLDEPWKTKVGCELGMSAQAIVNLVNEKQEKQESDRGDAPQHEAEISTTTPSKKKDTVKDDRSMGSTTCQSPEMIAEVFQHLRSSHPDGIETGSREYLEIRAEAQKLLRDGASSRSIIEKAAGLRGNWTQTSRDPLKKVRDACPTCGLEQLNVCSRCRPWRKGQPTCLDCESAAKYHAASRSLEDMLKVKDELARQSEARKIRRYERMLRLPRSKRCKCPHPKAITDSAVVAEASQEIVVGRRLTKKTRVA